MAKAKSAVPNTSAGTAPAAAGAAAPAAGAAAPDVQPFTPAPKPKAPELRDALFVKSVPGVFRRCGFSFNQEGVGIALDALTPEQIEALESEPNLRVERVQFPADEDA